VAGRRVRVQPMSVRSPKVRFDSVSAPAGRRRGGPILGVFVDAGTFESAVSRLLAAPARGERLRAHFCTVHTIVEAQDRPDLRDLLNTADLVAPDGMPLVWLQRASGRTCERVCGPDLMLALLDRGRATGARHFFYGGVGGVAVELARRMAARYPGLRVAGTESPPFRPLSPEEDAAAVARINAAAPDFVWVGLGSPRQEQWLASHRDRLAAPVLLAVGAAFDFHAGRRPRAPKLMQRTGTEWLFRFATEPGRLGRRYLVTNARFIRLLAGERFRSLDARRRRR
jgi:N-acetylglucosaminyldiphosphoundecaprenol N-acetyl-beta-D-mannosaminyltransferase